MSNIDWDRLIADEDRLIDNHDRRYRRHNHSLEGMSEELVYRISVEYQEKWELDACGNSFVAMMKNEKLIVAMSMLTAKQRRVIELHFGCGLRHREIADTLGCKRHAVSELIARALIRLREHL